MAALAHHECLCRMRLKIDRASLTLFSPSGPDQSWPEAGTRGAYRAQEPYQAISLSRRGLDFGDLADAVVNASASEVLGEVARASAANVGQ